jgi:hypothetical protein
MRVSGLVLLLIAACAGGTKMRVLSGPEALQMHESFDLEAARASRVPEGVSFRIEGEPRRGRGQLVELDGVLSNASSQEQSITVFPAGPLGFVLSLAPGQDLARKPRAGPPQPPPVPPPPLVIALPARAQVRLRTFFDAGEYELPPGGELELEWTYWFWNQPQPQGRVRVRVEL